MISRTQLRACLGLQANDSSHDIGSGVNMESGIIIRPFTA
jgi:hypothetical protein